MTNPMAIPTPPAAPEAHLHRAMATLRYDHRRARLRLSLLAALLPLTALLAAITQLSTPWMLLPLSVCSVAVGVLL